MRKSTHDEVVASQSNETGMPEYIVEEVVSMSVFEIVTIVLGVISLLISLGTLIITLLSYLNDKKQK